MNRLICAIMWFSAMAWVSQVQASAIFTIENGGLYDFVDPIESAQSAAAFYSYNSPYPSSGDPLFGTQSGTGLFWLFQDTVSSNTSLGMIFDTPHDGSGGSVSLSSSGFPAGAYVSVEDDGGDIIPSQLINGTETWNWLACCTDGAMISGLSNEWTISLDLLHSVGVDNWYFLSGPDSSNPDVIQLNMDHTLYINSNSSVVPEPSVIGLFGLGLAGLYVVRRRRRF